MRTTPDLDHARGKVYVWVANAFGAGKLRDGPTRVANETAQSPAPAGQVTADVGVYQDRPPLIWLCAASHWSVPNGSNAFGQPFQPSSVKAPSVAPDHVCHVLSRSGWPKSVPPSSTPTVTPSPAKPAFQASVKLCVLASITSSLRSCSKFEPFGAGALL